MSRGSLRLVRCGISWQVTVMHHWLKLGYSSATSFPTSRGPRHGLRCARRWM